MPLLGEVDARLDGEGDALDAARGCRGSRGRRCWPRRRGRGEADGVAGAVDEAVAVALRGDVVAHHPVHLPALRARSSPGRPARPGAKPASRPSAVTRKISSHLRRRAVAAEGHPGDVGVDVVGAGSRAHRSMRSRSPRGWAWGAPSTARSAGSPAWPFTATMGGWSVTSPRSAKRAMSRSWISCSAGSRPRRCSSPTRAKASSLASSMARQARAWLSICRSSQRQRNCCTSSRRGDHLDAQRADELERAGVDAREVRDAGHGEVLHGEPPARAGRRAASSSAGAEATARRRSSRAGPGRAPGRSRSSMAWTSAAARPRPGRGRPSAG